MTTRNARAIARTTFGKGRRTLYRRTFARVPRRLLSGTVTGAPDFVGVGAQRSGTSWWYGAIADHPSVYRLPFAPKEYHYFDSLSPTRFDERAIERYHRLFPRPVGKLAGEWTPRYMFDPWTPQLLALAAPDARLIVLLRDPVERFRSGVANASRKSVRHKRIEREALERGFYFAQLSRLLEQFDRNQVLVLQYERCRAQPLLELRRTYAFLGLDDTHSPVNLKKTVNASVAKLTLDQSELDRLRRTYSDDAARLFDTFPELDSALWTTLAL